MTATSGPEFLHGEIPEPFNIAEYFFDARAAQHPQRLAIAGEPREVTYGELPALANRVGNALLEQGVSRGDRVLIVLPDSAEFVAAFFGAAKIGAVAVPVNSFARAADYEYWLADCGARFAIVHASALHEFGATERRRSLAGAVVVGQ